MAKIELREYQSRSLSLLYDWLRNNSGNVVISLPTGSGKSIVIAELCRRAITEYPETRILMLTRSIELINQNTEKLKTIWPSAPIGIYSASVGKKDLSQAITIGGPLSVVRVAQKLGKIDLLICDECHDISHNDEGSYRKIINALTLNNPEMRVVGYTASPYRLGHGLIIDKPAVFDALIEPASIEELIFKGYLSTLKSKQTKFKLDTSSVHKRGGDFIESELQKAVDTDGNNEAMIDEVIQRAEGRKSWMFFSSGVQHAKNLRDILIQRGISAVSVTGEMSKLTREKAITDFKSGKITAITQVGCLNVGFDHPDIDLLVMARPTMSPGLYLQQAGRGMRPKSHTDHCMVLDFAGNVSLHGPITNVTPPKKKGEGDGDAPTKVCEHCHEICHISAKICPNCKNPFPAPPEKKFTLHTDDIMGIDGREINIKSWSWRKHVSRASGKSMLSCTYYGAALSDAPVTEYLAIGYEGYAGDKALQNLYELARGANAKLAGVERIDGDEALIFIASQMNASSAPSSIEYKLDGKFCRVIKRSWSRAPQETDIFA